MIWRVRSGKTVLDFGSQQAAVQLLDNYPPHVREKVVYKEITVAEIEEKLAELRSDISRNRRDDAGDIVTTVQLEWLLSRLDFYEKALPFVQAKEREIEEIAQSRIGRYSSEVNEIWRDEGELQRRQS